MISVCIGEDVEKILQKAKNLIKNWNDFNKEVQEYSYEVDWMKRWWDVELAYLTIWISDYISEEVAQEIPEGF